jgi:hypothetical protein
MLQEKWKRASKMVDFISSSFLTFLFEIKRKEHSTRSEQRRAENTYNLQNRIALIINHLHSKTHETTGKKPAKPEIECKPNMTTKPLHTTISPTRAINMINKGQTNIVPSGMK